MAAFADKWAGNLSNELFNSMLAFYIGLRDQMDPVCKVYKKENFAYCGEKRSQLKSKLLKEFKSNFGY